MGQLLTMASFTFLGRGYTPAEDVTGMPWMVVAGAGFAVVVTGVNGQHSGWLSMQPINGT